MAISAKMLQYRGAYENFRPSVLLPGQFAVVLSGDPNTTTGKAVYMCFETGKATRILADGDVASGGGVSDAQIAEAVENYLANNPINIPVASENTLGGVKPVAKTSSMTQPVGVDAEGKLFTAPGGSGGSVSWNDILDRPFYGSVVKGEALYNDTVKMSQLVDTLYNTTFHVSTGLIVGESYEVVFNGITYSDLTCFLATIEGEPYPIIGSTLDEDNATLIGDYPFLIAYIAEYGACTIYALDTGTSLSLEIYPVVKSIKTLDEKYIPDTIARKADIPSGSDVDLSEYYTKTEIDAKFANIATYADAEGVAF